MDLLNELVVSSTHGVEIKLKEGRDSPLAAKTASRFWEVPCLAN